MWSRWIALIVAIACAAGAWTARVRLEVEVPGGRSEKQLLYLPNGRYLKVISLDHAPLIADVLYLWAIQYYSDYEREDRFRYVRHVFGDVIGELDPRFVDPYWLGALILIVEARDLEAGLELLDRGFEANPSAWVLPYVAGWECEGAGMHLRAAAYFEKAAKAPDAPSFVSRMRAGMLARAGDLPEAIRLWEQIRDDPAGDATTRAIAESHLRRLNVHRDLEVLRRSIDEFLDRRGRRPRNLREMVEDGTLRILFTDPDGQEYGYDPITGQVSGPAAQILGAD